MHCVCGQQSAELYIHFATLWVSSGIKTYEMIIPPPPFFSPRLNLKTPQMQNEFSWNLIFLVFAQIPLLISDCLKSNFSNQDTLSSLQSTQHRPIQNLKNFIRHMCPGFLFLCFT